MERSGSPLHGRPGTSISRYQSERELFGGGASQFYSSRNVSPKKARSSSKDEQSIIAINKLATELASTISKNFSFN